MFDYMGRGRHHGKRVGVMIRGFSVARRQSRSEDEPWRQTGVITHCGIIRALIGLKVPNGAVLRIDPTQPDREPELLFVPEAG
jgi:hypothetical protein